LLRRAAALAALLRWRHAVLAMRRARRDARELTLTLPQP